MLVSCMTVGLIATDAAYDSSEVVGGWPSPSSSNTYSVNNGITSVWGQNKGPTASYSGNTLSYDFYLKSTDTAFDVAFYCNGWGSDGRVVPKGGTQSKALTTSGQECEQGRNGTNGSWNVAPSTFCKSGYNYTKITIKCDVSGYSWNGAMYYAATGMTNLSPTLSVPSTGTVGTAITLTGGSTDTGKIGTLTKTYQYSTDNGSTWNDLASGSYTASSAGTVKFRYKVSDDGVKTSGTTVNGRTARVEYSSEESCTFSSSTYSVTASAGSNGSAVISKTSPVSGSSTSVSFNNGTTNNVYVKATPNQYYKVGSWSPTPSSTSTDDNGAVTATFSVSSATAISVTFEEDPVYSIVGSKSLTGTTNDWDISSTSTEMTKSGTSYTKTFNNIAAGTYLFKVAKNHAWSDAVGYSEGDVTGDGLVTNVEGSDDSNNGLNISFTTSDSANITITFTPENTVVISAVSNKNKLTAPTNVKISNSTSATVTATPNSNVTLSWSSVSNAGSYKIYRDDELVATVTTTTYSIAEKYSNRGTYKVVAVPSNSSTHSESDKSSGATLTVNRTKLTAPTVSISPTEIAKGDSTTATFSNYSSLSSYITNGYATLTRGTRAYGTTGSGAFTSTAAVTSTTGSETLTPESSIQYGYYMAVTTEGAEYYTQSNNSAYTNVYVSAPTWYLVGDLVDSSDNKWNTSLQDYPVDEYVSKNVFKRRVTYTSGNDSAKHYFRLNNGTNQYTVADSTDTNMSTHTTSGTAVTASTATTSGSMYVTGQGTFTIYVDQSTSNSPKVWVEKTEAQKYTTIVYVNQDSGATNMYVWKDANNKVSEWPGEDLTTASDKVTTETVNDIPYYKYTFESYWDHFDIVVNKGNGQNQSADLTNIAASKTYYVIWDGGSNTTASISETAPYIQLGYKKGDNGTVNHLNFNSNRTVSVTLDANSTYNFWMKSANTHYNDENSGTMTRLNCTGWHFPNNDTDTKIQTDLAGTYTFTYTVTNGEFYVSVTYPPEPKYNVTIDQGDHGTLKVDGAAVSDSSIVVQLGEITKAIVEAVAAEGYHFKAWTTTGGVAAESGFTTSSNPISIGASAAGTMTATYEENSYTLTLASAGNGSITTPSSKTLTVHPITATSLSGVTVTPANGYKFNGWTAGTGVTLENGSTTNPSTGTIKATQNSTLTANFTKVSYTLTGQTALDGTVGNYGTVTFYSDALCENQITTAQIGNTVYAKFTSSTHSLIDFSLVGTGATAGTTTDNVFTFTMGYSATTVTANVRPQSSVTYYVDMHGNSMSGKTVQVAIVTNMGGGTVVKDGNGNNCSATLTQQGSSTVYAATINTPVTQSGTSYSDLYVKVTYTGKTPTVVNLPGAKVARLVSTNEMWLEAENEESTQLTVNYSTRSTSTVPEGSRRIYVAKPYSWETSETNWATLGIYHWGEYTDIGWSNGIRMNYLGNSGSDGYHYYYADIPKAINGNKVSNIIFQGWNSTNPAAGTSPNAQTGNIENIPDSANFFYLSKEDGTFVGTKSEEDAVIANYTRYVSSVTMNKTESTEVNIKPTYTGEDITYTSGNTSVVTVDSNGKITPQGRGTTNITVKIYGTIGSLLTTEDNDHKDYITYPVSVTVKDPTQFNGFEPMSFESKTYTVNIPTVSGDQPGYFDMSNVVMTVEGIRGVASSTSSAIITQTSTASVSGIGTVCTAFTVKYAKANTDYTNYNGIHIIGKTVTKSIRRTDGQRYGHDHWTEDGTTKTYTTSRVIDSGVETATTEGIPFDDTKATYSDIFAAYSYVDVTFTFNYYEYKPKKVDADGNVVADNVEGMIQYPYDSTWAGGEVTSNANFAASHTQKTFTVSNYEVRGKTADNITTSDLATAAATAIGVMPSNNYYTYSIAAANTTKTITGTYTANSTVNMTQNIRRYSVYLNGTTVVGTNYTYQQYAEPSVNNASDWYAVDSSAQNASTDNAPLLATNVNSYKFRVKGDTYLRTKTATNPRGYDFIRSEVDFSHYEVVHRENPQHNVVDYLMQNFYIADFFSPSEVLDPNTDDGNGGHLQYDDAQFVGGGVVYYSMNGATENNQGTPFANAVSSGYVNGSDGKINANAIKEMLKSNIEAQYAKDNIAGTVGEEDAMKAAYGTEIAATKNVEGGFNTGIIYRYLPLNQYTRYGSGEKTVDITVSNDSNITNYTLTTKDQTTQKWGCSKSQTSTADPEIANGKRTIRFTNNQNWDAVFVHFWGGSSASNWPGIRMTDKDNNVFEAVIPADATQIVFNDGCSMPATDENGSYTLDYSVNNNTFRYSNSLQSYQYVYASGNENKATNAGKNMRLYSYYVYSYVTYDQETNVPVTKYEIVISDNYSDASTYWEGNPNPDPSN